MVLGFTTAERSMQPWSSVGCSERYLGLLQLSDREAVAGGLCCVHDKKEGFLTEMLQLLTLLKKSEDYSFSWLESFLL